MEKSLKFIDRKLWVWGHSYKNYACVVCFYLFNAAM